MSPRQPGHLSMRGAGSQFVNPHREVETNGEYDIFWEVEG